jgi:hypothetical protein
VPKTSVAAPVPQRATATSEPTAVLAKRVNALGMCTVARLDPTDDPWFPPTQIKAELAERARTACIGCPVIAECREMTLRREAELPESQINGIFGALAPHERIAIIRARRGGGQR